MDDPYAPVYAETCIHMLILGTPQAYLVEYFNKSVRKQQWPGTLWYKTEVYQEIIEL